MVCTSSQPENSERESCEDSAKESKKLNLSQRGLGRSHDSCSSTSIDSWQGKNAQILSPSTKEEHSFPSKIIKKAKSRLRSSVPREIHCRASDDSDTYPSTSYDGSTASSSLCMPGEGQTMRHLIELASDGKPTVSKSLQKAIVAQSWSSSDSSNINASGSASEELSEKVGRVASSSLPRKLVNMQIRKEVMDLVPGSYSLFSNLSGYPTSESSFAQRIESRDDGPGRTSCAILLDYSEGEFSRHPAVEITLRDF